MNRTRLSEGLVGLILMILTLTNPQVSAAPVISEAAGFLPDAVNDFKATEPATDFPSKLAETGEFGAVSTAARIYQNDAGNTLTVELVHTQNDAAAYSLLTRSVSSSDVIKPDTVGLAAILRTNAVMFCKGDTLAAVSWTNTAGTSDQLLSFARSLAAGLPLGDDEIPVLVKHLPEWESKIGQAKYSVTLAGLKSVVADQPILDSISFDGGTEAVTANYNQGQLLIVEFTTPQMSIDNDQRIAARIQELKSQLQPAPSAYKRVGNYSVFVFNAANEQSATQLLDQVKYQQVVQWLGEDPHLYERLQRYFANTTSGVLVSVLESSGLSLLACLGLGGIIGALLFRHRRAQQAAVYSDAGGSVRLNLDELSHGRAQRLISSASKSGSDSERF